MLNATVELVTAPDTVEVGKPFAATFRLSNHGEALPQGLVKLGSWAPQDNRNWGDTRVQLPFAFAPQQNENFEVGGFVAQQTGSLSFSWRPVWEGLRWFGTPSAAKPIKVVPASGVDTPPSPPPAPPPTNPPGVIFGKWPKKRADAFDLVGAMVINTDAFAANGKPNVVRWVNTTLERIRISAARIWLGVSQGGKCDAHGQLEREDGSLVAVLQADHYVDGPAGAAVEHQSYSGAYLALESGEALTFTYFANGFTPGCQAHFTVSLWGHYG